MDNQDEDKLMVYFMGQTNERLAQIESKLVELIEFRAEVLSTARSTAIWISVLSSLMSMIVGYVLRKVGM